MAREIRESVEAMEAEADRLLEEAKSRAAEILQKAREEARAMAIAELPLDDVNEEAAGIVREAEEKADPELEAAETKAAAIRAGARGKTEEYARRMLGIVLGERAG